MWAQDVAVPRPGTTWSAFLGWVLLGAGIGAGFGLRAAAGLLVGLLLVLVAGLLVVRQGPRPAQWGVLTGLSALPTSIAWLNRYGADPQCVAASVSCTPSGRPLPFLAVALVMVVIGVVLFVRMRRAPRLIDPPKR